MGIQDRLQQKSDELVKSLKQNVLTSKNKQTLLYAYSVARSLNYTVQASALPLIDRLATGKKREGPKNFTQHIKEALPKIDRLLKQDVQNIVDQHYPVEVLKPEAAHHHLGRIPGLVLEALNTSRRREQNITHDFNEDTEEFHREKPEYYSRNFHFQNSGYLSTASAEFYEHQVEMLFSGTAGAMRRLIIPELKRRLTSGDGEGLHFLEVGSGSGSLTEYMALAFPKAKITCVDLSPYYLKAAQAKLKNFSRISFVEASGESLPFKENTFDVVYSCYLFHELPMQIRQKVVSESLRVLKSQGLLGAVDSLQIGDDSSLDWALKQFPIDFHEPFYKNYTQNKLEDLWTSSQLQNLTTDIGFLSKAVVGQK